METCSDFLPYALKISSTFMFGSDEAREEESDLGPCRDSECKKIMVLRERKGAVTVLLCD